MIKFFKWIYTAYSALIFVLLMFIFGIFIVVPILISQKGDRVSFIFIHLWAKIWAFLSGIRIDVHGREKIDWKKPYIFIFNHRSYVDAPIIPLTIPQELRALGKKELSIIPFFGWIVGRFAVWVNRTSAESRKESLEKLLRILQSRTSVIVAPEGTRNNTSETLLPFHKGAFQLSVETRIPILPIAVIGAEEIMKRGSFLMSPGKVRIYFSEPMNPPAPSEHAIKDFTEKCRNRLEAMIITHE